DRSHLVMRVIAEVFAAEFPAADESLIDRIELDCRNRIPHSRGLGSSAAAVVAGIGLNSELGGLTTGARLDRRRILEIATDFEGHPDNAAPAIFGGLTITLSEPARNWHVPVLTIDEVTDLIPDRRLDPDVARTLYPAVIDHDIASENSARSGLLVHGLVNDPSAIFEATSDKLHQKFRRSVYPESMALVDTLRGH